MMLFAQGRRGDTRRVLLVLQGMDTSGKGGVIRHAVALVDPQGLDITTFGAPTKKELRYDFLWRIRRNVPAPGMVGVFDRSHYEDVLVAKVRSLVPKKEIEGRYAAISAFESELAEQGVIVVKCFLHIDREVQRERLLARLDDPTKHWKYDPGDLDDRAHWDDYIAAYQEAIERCNDPRHRGTSCRRPASGTATGPSPRCCWSTSTPSTCPGRRPTSTSTSSDGCCSTPTRCR
jgi:PPK2 family polyphosphate:nucleotide phosphotransferase